MATEVLTIKENGKFTLPDDIVERYQFKRETQFRIIETQKGVLLVPMTNEPMNERTEIRTRRMASNRRENAWEMFDFEENCLMNVGEIFWVEFPARGGRAQAGRRPAIVVQKEKSLPTVLLVPLTTQQDALRFACNDSHRNLTNKTISAMRPSRSFFN